VSRVHIIDDKEPTLEELQKLVGGYIEVYDVDSMQIVLNEEGRLIGLPVNKKAMDYLQKELNSNIKTGGFKISTLVGDVVILKGKGKLT